MQDHAEARLQWLSLSGQLNPSEHNLLRNPKRRDGPRGVQAAEMKQNANTIGSCNAISCQGCSSIVQLFCHLNPLRFIGPRCSQSPKVRKLQTSPSAPSNSIKQMHALGRPSYDHVAWDTIRYPACLLCGQEMEGLRLRGR